jgi:hypothetical protein
MIVCITVLPLVSLATSTPFAPIPQTEGINIENTMAIDNELSYLTYIQYTTNDKYEVEGTFRVSTNQSIVYDVGHLFVREYINVNTTNPDYSTILNKNYNYTINATINLPANTTAEFPAVFNGGWQHNYPYQASQIVLNNQEISYAFKKGRDITLAFQEDSELIFDNVKITVQKFTGSLNFQVTCGSG